MKLFALVAIANIGILFASRGLQEEKALSEILAQQQDLLSALALKETQIKALKEGLAHERMVDGLKQELATLKKRAKAAAKAGKYVESGKMTAKYTLLEEKIVSLEEHGRRLKAEAKAAAKHTDFKGVRIKDDKAILTMGKAEDVKIWRSGAKELTAAADLHVRGKFSVNSVDIFKRIETIEKDVKDIAKKTAVPKCPFTKGRKVYEKYGSTTSWTAPKCVKTITVLVVAGGGGGGGRGGGGGGAGGLLYKANYPVTAGTSYKVFVGAGGKGGCGSGGSCGRGHQGQNSQFGPLTAIGGGYGGGDRSGSSKPEGGAGGSGGGGYEVSCGKDCPGGKGVTGQGTRGGDGTKGPIHDSGGGGGAGESGGHARARGNGHGGHGGAGRCFSEFAGYGDGKGCFAGGGGGAVHNPCKSGGVGGKGGGGNAGGCCNKPGSNGRDKTGSGGGGGSTCSGSGAPGGRGGSGVVIVTW